MQLLPVAASEVSERVSEGCSPEVGVPERLSHGMYPQEKSKENKRKLHTSCRSLVVQETPIVHTVPLSRVELKDGGTYFRGDIPCISYGHRLKILRSRRWEASTADRIGY